MNGAVPVLPLYAFKTLMEASLPSSSPLPFSMGGSQTFSVMYHSMKFIN
jgi:hypothetical protein